ncbi:hypothetical protein C8R47DRAFT_562573 [Mycena vitilis]|nr:hypothetical protein C8R47DRAFT_562573 [Mycena vitilis]
MVHCITYHCLPTAYVCIISCCTSSVLMYTILCLDNIHIFSRISLSSHILSFFLGLSFFIGLDFWTLLYLCSYQPHLLTAKLNRNVHSP